MDSINILTLGQKWIPIIFCLLTLISSFFLIGDSAVLITTDPVIKEIDLMYDNQYKDVLLHADTYADFYLGGIHLSLIFLLIKLKKLKNT